MEEILLREHEAGRSLAPGNRVNDAVRAHKASAATAVLARNDDGGELCLAQPLNIGEREGGRPVVFARGLGELARERGRGHFDVVERRIEDHGASSAAMASVKTALTTVEASIRLPISPER